MMETDVFGAGKEIALPPVRLQDVLNYPSIAKNMKKVSEDLDQLKSHPEQNGPLHLPEKN